MSFLIKKLKTFLKNAYISFYYLFRKKIKWKKLNSIYLNIDHKIISKPLFGNIVFGDYEIDENRILNKTLYKDDILLELGTGLGFNSITAAKINNNKVATFEGNPHLIPLIKQNMKRNNVDFCLKNKIILSKHSAESIHRFNIVEDFWSSSLKNNISGKIIEVVSVSSAHVNEILQEVRPTYLLVDIEGGEEDLFDDCTFLKTSSIKKILIELHADIIGKEKCARVIEKIEKSGFKTCSNYSTKNVAYLFREE